jgi:Xaa-Pro dipeptidase
LRFLFVTILICFIALIYCQTNTPGSVSTDIWKGLPSNLLNKAEISSEISYKMNLLKDFLKKENLDGMMFTQVRNFYWITAGQANNQIVLNKDVGAASALVMKDGLKYLICNDSEAPRLMNEVMKDLGYELKRYDWYEANPAKDVRGDIIKEIAKSGKIGSDINFPNTILAADKFKPLRFQLTETEMKRYRWLGKQTTEAVETVCKKLVPGMNEYEIEAMTAAELRSRGIMPTVLLIGVDDRIYNYRHALPAGAVLKNYAMVNVVAEKWGMPMAVTRFIHFGPLPEELKNKIEKTSMVNAHYQAATVPGKPCAEIFEECKQWYADAGFPGEWKKHHQGGAIGYDDREYVIYPGIQETVLENQAFAWNPTITGAKVEDTIIAHKNGFEVITRTEDWPLLNVELNGKVYPQPTILVK